MLTLVTIIMFLSVKFYFKTVHTVSPPVRSRLVVIIMVKSHCEATDENASDRIRIEKTLKYYDEDRDIKNTIRYEMLF